MWPWESWYTSRAPTLSRSSFPARRSSDLAAAHTGRPFVAPPRALDPVLAFRASGYRARVAAQRTDRKSTRLNSSHLGISYAVFCLKKKNRPQRTLVVDFLQRFCLRGKAGI